MGFINHLLRRVFIKFEVFSRVKIIILCVVISVIFSNLFWYLIHKSFQFSLDSYYVGVLFSTLISFFIAYVMAYVIISAVEEMRTLKKLAIIDNLSLLYNRRYFNDVFERELKRCKRDNKSLTLAILDVDNFRKYNEKYGQGNGDNLLMDIASILKNSLKRPSDYVFRLGGEEFGMLFIDSNKEKSLDFANFIRQQVEDLKIKHHANVSEYCTVSAGIYVCYPDEDFTREIIYNMADKALYSAKTSGKNRVEIFEDGTSSSKSSQQETSDPEEQQQEQREQE